VTTWSDSYLARLVPGVEAAADPVRAAGTAAYMRPQFVFLGVGLPRLRELAGAARSGLAEPAEDDLADLVDALWAKAEREYQHVGLEEMKRNARRLPPGFLWVVERLITTRSWWDTVDALATRGAGVLVANHPELRAEMDRWLDDDDLWLRRSALLHQLHWRERTDADWLFAACLRRSGERDFFIRKAIGWALREYSKTEAAAVREFVASHQDSLSPLSRREALKWLARRG
jgi:3-methyladenine DNA glycosylase AlkD